MESVNEIKRGNKIKNIIKLFEEGKSIDEIIQMGYHKATTNIQIKKYIKNKK